MDDNTEITFYKNGMFSIREIEIEKLDNPSTTNDVQLYSEPLEEESKTDRVEFL